MGTSTNVVGNPNFGTALTYSDAEPVVTLFRKRFRGTAKVIDEQQAGLVGYNRNQELRSERRSSTASIL